MIQIGEGHYTEFDHTERCGQQHDDNPFGIRLHASKALTTNHAMKPIEDTTFNCAATLFFGLIFTVMNAFAARAASNDLFWSRVTHGQNKCTTIQ